MALLFWMLRYGDGLCWVTFFEVLALWMLPGKWVVLMKVEDMMKKFRTLTSTCKMLIYLFFFQRKVK